MTLIDQIKKDREAGTPGPFDVSAVSIVWKGGHQRLIDAGADVGAVMHALYSGEADADIRRIGRVPDMEAALLAAEELARICDEVDRYRTMPIEMMDALTAYREATNHTTGED